VTAEPRRLGPDDPPLSAADEVSTYLRAPPTE
jgi:hypothetical protein